MRPLPHVSLVRHDRALSHAAISRSSGSTSTPIRLQSGDSRAGSSRERRGLANWRAPCGACVARRSVELLSEVDSYAMQATCPRWVRAKNGSASRRGCANECALVARR